MDIGKSYFATFPPRCALTYADLLIQRQISPCATMKAYRKLGTVLLIDVEYIYGFV